MNEDKIQELIENAKEGDIDPDSYRAAVDSLGLEPKKEAFMKATGLGLIAENRAGEVSEMAENMLSEKYRTDDVFDSMIDELDNLDRIYREDMEQLTEKLSYSAEVWEEVKENIEQAADGDIYVDIDITDEGDTTVINNPPSGSGGGSPGDGGSDEGSDDGGYSRREILALAAAGFGGAALGSTLFGGALFGAGKEDESEQGYLKRDTLPAIREETEDYFRNILDENEWSYATDDEGMDLAGISIRREGNNFDYKLFNINTNEITDNNWKTAESTEELLENYDSVKVSEWESLGNEDLGEYMLDASKSDNPEKLNFDNYLED